MTASGWGVTHTGFPQAQRYIGQLKAQINTLEAELEEQRKQKQKALVDNEQLRAAQQEGARHQGLLEEAESAWGHRGIRGMDGGRGHPA